MNPDPSPRPATRGLSLERRLPLLITGLLAAILAAGLLFAHQEVRNTATSAARERLRLATQQLATLVGSSVPARMQVMRPVAADPALAALLGDPQDQAARQAASAVLRRLVRPDEPTLPIQLWDRTRRPVVQLGAYPDPRDPPPRIVNRTLPDATGIGPFFRHAGRSFFWLASPVVRGADTIGWVAEMRRVGGPGAAPIEALIGGGVDLYFAGRHDQTWVAVDGTLTPAPPVWPFVGPAQYELDGQAYFAHANPVAGTPWSMVSTQNRAVVMERPDTFLRHAAVAAVALVIAGAAGAWLVSRNITRPVRELRLASEAIAQGDYARRIQSGRADELGVLADQFDRMAAQVQASHDELREQYETAQSLAEELEHANEQLETALGEADAARDEAEAANRSKSEFLATMSHEIRTPINAIIGYTELMMMELEGPLTPGQRAQMGRVEFSSRHLTGLVDQLLDFARIEAGSLRVERRTAGAGDAIAAAVTVLGPEAAAKGVALHAACDGAARYQGDPQRVDQILLNLLSNAIKFTASGGRAELRCQECEGPLPTDGHAGRWVCIRVQDTGIGIPPEQMERIFEPFVQVESGYTRRHGGAGLGLAISRRFARWMGGDLTVESAVGTGSAFTLWLPAAPASAH
jgi:signal transduction histidine kinase